MLEVRLIDANGDQVGVISTKAALSAAKEAGLDLVEISPNAVPPVCRIMDYGKFTFEQSKRRSLARKKQKQVQVKEVKFRPATDVGDFNVKVKKIQAFLERGDKVKVSLRFRGREMQHTSLAAELFDRITHALEAAVVEQAPKLEGRQMAMILVAGKKEGPKKNTPEKSEQE